MTVAKTSGSYQGLTWFFRKEEKEKKIKGRKDV